MLTDQEIREELRKQKFDRERAEAFGRLVATEAWQWYVELLNNNIGERTAMLLEPVEDGKHLASEHNKGTVYGLIYARDLLPHIIAVAKELKTSDPADEEK